VLSKNDKFSAQKPLIQASATEIQIVLFSKYYQMIHFAGDGVFDPIVLNREGLIIGANTDLSQPILFTPAKFKQFAHIPN